jgi:ketosteroid isomerase-like protein
MLQEKVEIVRSMYEAFNVGEIEVALTYLHPEPEMQMSAELPDQASYHGLAEFQHGLTGWLEAWKWFRFEIEGLADADARVLMEIRLWGVAKGSGIETERAVFHVWRFQDGKPQRCEVYANRAEALEAVGLAE